MKDNEQTEKLIRYTPVLSNGRAVMEDSVSGEFVRLDEVSANPSASVATEMRSRHFSNQDVASGAFPRYGSSPNRSRCDHSDFDMGVDLEEGSCPLCLGSALADANAYRERAEDDFAKYDLEAAEQVRRIKILESKIGVD